MVRGSTRENEVAYPILGLFRNPRVLTILHDGWPIILMAIYQNWAAFTLRFMLALQCTDTTVERDEEVQSQLVFSGDTREAVFLRISKGF